MAVHATPEYNTDQPWVVKFVTVQLFIVIWVQFYHLNKNVLSLNSLFKTESAFNRNENARLNANNVYDMFQ